MFGSYFSIIKQCWSRFNRQGLYVTLKCSFSSENRIFHESCVRSRRAVLYIPGHDKRKIEKLRSLNLDCAVLDCEDGVAQNKKEEARKTISIVSQDIDFGKTEYAVRINSIDSGLAKEDLKVLLSTKKIPELIMVPKVESTEHIDWLNNEFNENLIDKNQSTLKLMIFVESAFSLLELREICKRAVELSKKGKFSLVGIVFGSDDFCASIGATRTEDALEILLARQMVVLIAKAFGLQAIDMVHINYKDLEGLSKVSKEGYCMGFTGKQVIHPAQVPVVQKCFSPSKEKVEWARELVKLFNEHQQEGKGAFTFRGAMIDKPTLLQAENILKTADN